MKNTFPSSFTSFSNPFLQYYLVDSDEKNFYESVFKLSKNKTKKKFFIQFPKKYCKNRFEKLEKCAFLPRSSWFGSKKSYFSHFGKYQIQNVIKFLSFQSDAFKKHIIYRHIHTYKYLFFAFLETQTKRANVGAFLRRR